VRIVFEMGAPRTPKRAGAANASGLSDKRKDFRGCFKANAQEAVLIRCNPVGSSVPCPNGNSEMKSSKKPVSTERQRAFSFA
jgi:hypothetical protein